MLPLASSLAADPIDFSSGDATTPLVELYTSEGCSSCPPADAWLGKLKEDRGLWKDFVPVAWHVDYWDRLGWKDRFSDGEWTLRQRIYAREWGSGSVYTPCFVWQGGEWRGWFSRESRPEQPKEKPGKLSATSKDGRQWDVTFQANDTKSDDWVAHVAILACDVSTSVKAGENRGRNLPHDFVALDLKKSDLKRSGTAFSGTVSLPESAFEGSDKRAAAVWVAHRNRQTPVQATGGYLAKK